MKVLSRFRQRLRGYFPNGFIWRLYVVVQAGALIWAVFIALLETDKGRPPIEFDYKTLYETVEIKPSEVEAARAKCAHLSDDPKGAQLRFAYEKDAYRRGQFELLTSPRERCFNSEKPRPHRPIGREFAGVYRINGNILLALLLALLGPFAAFRLPIWIWEGWRDG